MPRAAAPIPPVAPRVNPAQFVHGLLGAGENEFAHLARHFREELAARDLLEVLQIDLMLMALGMLRRALSGRPDADPKAFRLRALAHKMLSQALREFTRLRKRPDAIAEAPAAEATAARESAATPPRPEPAPTPARPPAPRSVARPASTPTPTSPPARPPADPFRDLLGPAPSFVNLAVGRPRDAARAG